MAFHPVSCLYTLNILGPVGHFGINNRLESENRFLVGFLLLSLQEKNLKCYLVLLIFSFPQILLPHFFNPFLQSYFHFFPLYNLSPVPVQALVQMSCSFRNPLLAPGTNTCEQRNILLSTQIPFYEYFCPRSIPA